jgi:hypothetical protein
VAFQEPNPTQNYWEFGFDYYHNYMIKTENLHLFPVYVRLDGGSRWHLEYIEIRGNPETENIIYSA